MQDDVEEGTVHVQLAVVVNDAWFVELIHGETDVEAHGAAIDHMRLLNRPGNDSVGLQQHTAVSQNTRSK